MVFRPCWTVLADFFFRPGCERLASRLEQPMHRHSEQGHLREHVPTRWEGPLTVSGHLNPGSHGTSCQDEAQKLPVISVFSGIGGLELGMSKPASQQVSDAPCFERLEYNIMIIEDLTCQILPSHELRLGLKLNIQPVCLRYRVKFWCPSGGG